MEPRKILALEGLRGVASLNVVLGHFLFSFFPYLSHHIRPYPSPVAKYAFEEIMLFPPFTFLYLADAAVSVFFVLSGYVLTRRFYETGRTTVFESAALRRYVRLVLPAFASVMFAWILLVSGAYANNLAGPLGTAGWVISLYAAPVSFIGAVFRGLIGAPLFGLSDLNGPLWTIQIELIGSILLFATYSLFAARSKFLLIFWFLFFAFVLGAGAQMLYYVSLLAGSLLHLVEPRLRASGRLATACLVLGLIGVSFSFAPAFKPLQLLTLPNLTPYGPNFQTEPRLFWHTLGATLLVAGVLGSGSARRLLNRSVPVYLGRVSFAIYLLHFPLIMSLSFRVAQFGNSIGMSYIEYALTSLVITLIVLFVLAELFYRYIDNPSLRLAGFLSKKTDARGPAMAPPTLLSVPAEVRTDVKGALVRA